MKMMSEKRPDLHPSVYAQYNPYDARFNKPHRGLDAITASSSGFAAPDLPYSSSAKGQSSVARPITTHPELLKVRNPEETHFLIKSSWGVLLTLRILTLAVLCFGSKHFAFELC
jgi:hypothetical protein